MKRYIQSTVSTFITLADWVSLHDRISPDYKIVVIDRYINKFDSNREYDSDYDLMFMGTFSELYNGFDSCNCNYFINWDDNPTQAEYYETLNNYEVTKEMIKQDNYWFKGTYILLEVYGME